jgi:hypothetical protein
MIVQSLMSASFDRNLALSPFWFWIKIGPAFHFNEIGAMREELASALLFVK